MASKIPVDRVSNTGKYLDYGPQDFENLEKQIKRKRQPKTLNVCNIIYSREIDDTSPLQTVKSFYKAKVAAKHLEQSNEIDCTSSFTIEDVEFIKGGVDSLYGLWTIKNSTYKYAFGELPLINMEENSELLGVKATNKCIEDMCHVFSDTLLYISNDEVGLGAMDMLWRNGSQFSMYKHMHSRRWPLYSCTDYGDQFRYLAVGGLNFISHYNGIVHYKDYPINARALAVSFDETSNLIASANSNGYLYVHDVRIEDEHALCISVKVEEGDNCCLVDTEFLTHSEIIVAGVSNRINTIDLRLLRPVNNFLGHLHSVKKRPMSIANNMLCLSGADNVIRIWHLSGGLPISEIRPDNEGKKIRGWLRGDGNKTYLYCFEGATKKVYEL